MLPATISVLFAASSVSGALGHSGGTSIQFQQHASPLAKDVTIIPEILAHWVYWGLKKFSDDIDTSTTESSSIPKPHKEPLENKGNKGEEIWTGQIGIGAPPKPFVVLFDTMS
ncbi:hypothetical protein RSOLAG22IIIB_10549 [Rhizoctonia solani]|uniref:Peptidase A1 domain-containing protein n=1 Tax=Rhizoctonia solani TaxID=456999 RepID=A0A0K6G440_9AGAM|nr:hypothetical protein RSOLAG22IIIB_10549 [Rhizoctonia solani]